MIVVKCSRIRRIIQLKIRAETIMTCFSQLKICLNACNTSINVSKVKLRDFTRTLRYMVSSFLAILFGTPHYRWLEQDKIKALKSSKGNFEKIMTSSNSALQDNSWWLHNLTHR